MKDYNLYWMNYSISIANDVDGSHLRVGAILISNKNELIFATSGSSKLSWCQELLTKVQECNINEAQSLYLTINTMNTNREFELNMLLRKINIHKIYLGVPDPNLDCYLDNDPFLVFECIYRYPENLQKEILNQNSQYYKNSRQSIKLNSYYSVKRISTLVVELLKSRGYVVTKNELENNKTVNNFIKFIIKKYNLEPMMAEHLINNILSEAFDEKYASYNYTNDARSLDLNWKDNFFFVYNKLFDSPLNDKVIVDVGVGSGNEAKILFSNCQKITFVDIAPNGLKKIKREFPNSHCVLSRAEKLTLLSDDSYDLYVSLRTYNSSFFDIKKAISEANRVLKSNAGIIISIANGFLDSTRNCIIPGLLIPGTNFVDVYRGIDMAKKLSTYFVTMGFKEVQILPTNIEIYLSAISM